MGLLTYLLQVSGCITLFYLFYYFGLSRLTFFSINRYYLISSLVLSFVIPLITIPVHKDYTVLAATNIIQLPSPATMVFKPAAVSNPVLIIHHYQGITWLTILKLVYAAVFTFLLLRFVAILAAFFIGLHKQGIERSNGLRIIRSAEKLKNGSFLNYIFLDDAQLKSEEAEQVIAHEILHVRLKHSIDRIVGRLAQIVLWFNPVMYLYTKAIEQNHEFEVDSLLTENQNKQNYAGLLLHLSVNARGLVYNNFAKTPLQQRITMLFNARSSKGKQLVYLLLLPLLTLSFIAFANMKRIYTPKALSRQAMVFSRPLEKMISQPIIQAEDQKAALIDTAQQSDTPTDNPGTNPTDTLPKLSVINGVEKLGKAPLVLIDGKEYPSDILYKIGSACIRGTGIWVPDSAVKYYGPKAKDGLVKITTRGQITEQTAADKNNLVVEHTALSAGMLARIVLQEDNGKPYDRVIYRFPNGAASIDVAHNAKVAFFIDSTFYTEVQMRTLLPKIREAMFSGTANLRKDKMPDGDLHGYESVMYFLSNPPTGVINEEKKTINWEKFDHDWEKRIPIDK